jgi:hypothetical protein
MLGFAGLVFTAMIAGCSHEALPGNPVTDVPPAVLRSFRADHPGVEPSQTRAVPLPSGLVRYDLYFQTKDGQEYDSYDSTGRLDE